MLNWREFCKPLPGSHECGAIELTAGQGTSDSWEDADVYDIAFRGAEAAHDQLLKVSGEGKEAVVQLLARFGIATKERRRYSRLRQLEALQRKRGDDISAQKDSFRK